MNGNHFLDQRRWFVASPPYQSATGQVTRDLTVVWALTTRQAAVAGIRLMLQTPEKTPWPATAKRAGVDVISAMRVWPVDTDETASTIATRGVIPLLSDHAGAPTLEVHR